MRVVGECFFWYRLTRVFPDKFHRAVKRLCCVCVCRPWEPLLHPFIGLFSGQLGKPALDNHASTSPLSFYLLDALPAIQTTALNHWRHGSYKKL